MFAYCRNNPICRKDSCGFEDVDCVDESNNNEKPFDDVNTSGGTRQYPNEIGTNLGSIKKQHSFNSEAALREHFEKHNGDFGNAFSSPQDYLDAANYVIENGQYLKDKNAYIKFYGYLGRANYAFVGMSRDHSFITTFHLKDATRIFK